jgi:hypothetical protein
METARNLMQAINASKPQRAAAPKKPRKPRVGAGGADEHGTGGEMRAPQSAVPGGQLPATGRWIRSLYPGPPTPSSPPRPDHLHPFPTPTQGLRPRPDNVRRSGRLTGDKPEFGEVRGDLDEEAVTYSDYEAELDDLLAGG